MHHIASLYLHLHTLNTYLGQRDIGHLQRTDVHTYIHKDRPTEAGIQTVTLSKAPPRRASLRRARSPRKRRAWRPPWRPAGVGARLQVPPARQPKTPTAATAVVRRHQPPEGRTPGSGVAYSTVSSPRSLPLPRPTWSLVCYMNIPSVYARPFMQSFAGIISFFWREADFHCRRY